MARPKTVVDEMLFKQAKYDLTQISVHVVCLRLQAVISSYTYPIPVVAGVFGVHPATVWRWIRQYRNGGTRTLEDRPKGHNPAKLTCDQREQVCTWVETGRNTRGQEVWWTLELLKQEIQFAWGVNVGITPLWIFLHQQGFRLKVPRPKHRSADIEAQIRFKKNCGTR